MGAPVLSTLPRFPTDISYRAVGGPSFKTDIVTMRTGMEQRNISWTQGRCQYNVSYGVRTQAQLNTLIDFFRTAEGRTTAFRFKDWADYTATAQHIGTGDGSTVEFQLRKAYIAGAALHYRKIYKPVNSTATIYVSSSAATNITLDYTKGTVTFDSAPSSSAMITATFQFDVQVRFDTDQLNIKLENYGVNPVTGVPLIEVRYTEA